MIFLFSFKLVNVVIGSLKIYFFVLQSPTVGVNEILSFFVSFYSSFFFSRLCFLFV